MANGDKKRKYAAASWNQRRSGAGSSKAKTEYCKATIRRMKPRVMVATEVTTKKQRTGSFDFSAQNITNRKANPAQLCFGAINGDGNEVKLTPHVPQSTAMYTALNFGGSNLWRNLADRGIGHYRDDVVQNNTTLFTVDNFFFHAPSGGSKGAKPSKAARAISFLLSDLVEHGKTNGFNYWIVLGDMNVSPDQFDAWTNKVFAAYMVRSGQVSFFNRKTSSELDYGFTNIEGAWLDTYRRSTRATNGDHHPVSLSFNYGDKPPSVK